MDIFFLLLSLVLSIEIFIFLNIKRRIKEFKSIIIKIKIILLSEELSDEIKAKELKSNALKLLSETFINICITIISFIPFIILLFIDYYLNFNFFNLLISIKGLILALISFLIYIKIRKYIVK